MRVIDLFCGCGGLSLGFQMAGFEVVYGLDNNKDAILSYERNFPTAKVDCKKIEDLSELDIPDAEIIIGGPPCVNFSSSKGSRANVLEGLKLVQAFLRFVWERKPQYWIMENVPRIGLHLPENIPLEWIGVNEPGFLDVPSKKLFEINKFGAPQNRKRLLLGNFPIPNPLNPRVKTLGEVVSSFPNPNTKPRKKDIKDPIFNLKIKEVKLTDHFYDTSLDPVEVRRIRGVKENHPYMGFMPFPDNLEKPARTVVALQMGRETLVLPSGKGKFRRPTVRECASYTNLPNNFQLGGKTVASRYKQIGNAVPPVLPYHIA